MAATKNNSITIIGGGLAGCFLAILLAKRNYKVELYERLSKKEIADTNSKRSYNITFRGYGIDMLKKADLWEPLQPHLLPLRGTSTLLSKDSKPIFSPIDTNNPEYFSVSRAALLNIMLKHMSEDPNISLYFETALLSADKHEKTIVVQNLKTKKITEKACNVIIGADGANSLVRTLLQQGQHASHTQEYSTGGYKQFTISKEQVKTLGFDADLGYTWSADNKFILAFPNFDGSLASLLIFPKDRKGFDSLKTKTALNKLIKDEFPLLLPIQNEVTEQLFTNPVGSFVTIHTDPWYYKDFMTLVGDAAHGFYPFFGQGTSAAFGDCIQLVKLIDKYGSSWEKVFPLYQSLRKKHMDALGELSKEAILRYMRNKRADYNAIYDTLEIIGNKFFPRYIKPPVFMSVMNDPVHTADYVEQHQRQRKIAKRIGIAIAVTALTSAVAVLENLQRTSKES